MQKWIIAVLVVLICNAAHAQSGNNTGTDYNPGVSPESPAGASPGFDVMYAPSENDDPAFRAAIAAITGGNVDYFDTRGATPTVPQMQDYECVMTWTNSAYSDNIAFGDNLAAYVDAGGSVVLGAFATFTSGNSLSGAIMGPGYAPVTGGGNHFATSSYAGDGTSPIHNGVVAYSAFWRDILTLQGSGVQDGSYVDGEIAAAYRPDFAVVYANGAGGLPVDGNDEDHPLVVANACMASGTFVPSPRATFEVTKDFTDGNPAGVEVTVSCNTGLPLEQSKVITEGEGVEFVVVDFDDGEMDCEVTEVLPAGYDAEYFNGFANSSTSCDYVNVGWSSAFRCRITNTPGPVDVVIHKDWVIEGGIDGADGISQEFQVTLTCDSEIVGGFELNNGWRAIAERDGEATITFEVIPDFPSTSCKVDETVFDSAVEVDNSCGQFEVSAADGHECTITNTVFFEGIPTLNQYGLALLALLMLGVGFVGFRRFA